MSSNSSDFTWHLIIAREAHVEPAVLSLSGHMNEEQREKFRNKLRRYVRKTDRDLILAVAGRWVIGFYTVIEHDDLPKELATSTRVRLSRFACGTGFRVHSDCRRRGVGASLQQRAEQWARERNKPGFWLSTHRQADWYRKHFGYEKAGRVLVKGVERSIMAKRF